MPAHPATRSAKRSASKKDTTGNSAKAHGFYGIIALATLAGLVINFVGIDPIQALIFTAVFNAVASVPLLWMIYRVGNNRDIMGAYKNSWLSNLGVVAAFLLMTGATLVLVYSLVVK